MSVVAEVNHPVTVKVPLGCTMDDVVAQAGGTTVKDPVYFIGGPMMGRIGKGSDPVTKTTNAILVLPKDHLIVQKKMRTSSIDLKRAASICCQCNTVQIFAHVTIWDIRLIQPASCVQHPIRISEM